MNQRPWWQWIIKITKEIRPRGKCLYFVLWIPNLWILNEFKNNKYVNTKRIRSSSSETESAMYLVELSVIKSLPFVSADSAEQSKPHEFHPVQIVLRRDSFNFTFLIRSHTTPEEIFSIKNIFSYHSL